MYDSKILKKQRFYEGNVAICTLLCKYNGKYVNKLFMALGVAAKQDYDKFDYEFGLKLAETKAREDMEHKTKKCMMEETYRPEWAEPNAITVTYTYTYDYKGEEVENDRLRRS